MRPDPPRLSRDGSGLAIGAGRKGRRGQLTKRRTCRLVRYPQMKEGPGGEAGAFKEETSQSRDQGALDAPILSQGTSQARRGTKCNGPGWADGETGDFKGLTLSDSGPVFLGSPGPFFRQGADRVKRHGPPIYGYGRGGP
jgi:hypothetical protein